MIQELSDGKGFQNVFSESRCKRFGIKRDQGLKLIKEYFTEAKRKQLSILMNTLAYLDSTIQNIEEVIKEANSHPEREKQIEILRSIPGIDWVAASIILAEVGDARKFESPAKLSKYAGLVPKSNQSGECLLDGIVIKKNRKGGLVTRCNRRLKWIMMICAEVVSRQKETPLNKHLKSFHKRRLGRRKTRHDKMKAKVALAHKMLKIVWTLLTKGEKYVGFSGVVKPVAPVNQREKDDNEEKDDDRAFVTLLKGVAGVLSEPASARQKDGQGKKRRGRAKE